MKVSGSRVFVRYAGRYAHRQLLSRNINIQRYTRNLQRFDLVVQILLQFDFKLLFVRRHFFFDIFILRRIATEKCQNNTSCYSLQQKNCPECQTCSLAEAPVQSVSGHGTGLQIPDFSGMKKTVHRQPLTL